MAEELGVFVPYVGGVEHASVLLPPLEGLCSFEETCVRERQWSHYAKLGLKMNESDMVDSFIPLVKGIRIADIEDNYIKNYRRFNLQHTGGSERNSYPEVVNAIEPLGQEDGLSDLMKQQTDLFSVVHLLSNFNSSHLTLFSERFIFHLQSKVSLPGT